MAIQLIRIAIGSLLLAIIFGITQCSDSRPVRMGFVAGLSGSGADLGGPARNGMLLAVEEANAQGGIKGRRIEVLIEDDKQQTEHGIRAVKSLIDQGVDVIIGPVTSTIATATVDLANRTKTLMFGLTVASNELAGIDDYFLRGLAPTRNQAASLASYLYHGRQFKSFSAVIDRRNAAYTQGWIENFREQFTKLGGRAITVLEFDSGIYESMPTVARQLINGDPDVVVLVTNAVDAGMLAKLVKERAPHMALATAEWAGTERLLELGGTFLEGAIVPQYIDREGQQPEYIAFRKRYIDRFNHEPGFPGVIAYDVTRAIIEGLRGKSETQHLKQVLLTQSSFRGVQAPLVLDEFGDALGRTYITEVRSGQFVLQDAY